METCATVVEARPLDGYRLELTFGDGLQGTIDLSHRIIGRGGIFQALEAPDFFRQVRVDPEFGTIVWPNQADFCPDLLHAWALAGEVPRFESASKGRDPVRCDYSTTNKPNG